MRRPGWSGRGWAAVAVVTSLAALTAAVPAGAQSPPAADGPAKFDGAGGLPFSPMSGPVAGGNAVRIYGMGLLGVRAVTFGGKASPRFAVVDSNVVLAVAPPGLGPGALVDVALTDPEGTATVQRAYFYSDATVTVTPASGLHDGDVARLVVRGYQEDAPANIAQASPLAGYYEPRPRALPPPFVDPLAAGATDANGNLDQEVRLSAEPNFNDDGDPAAQCPPTQDQVNLGLATCFVAVAQLGRATISAPISFAATPPPAPPSLSVVSPSVEPGATIKVTGANWGGNPNFGSSTAPSRPGETRLTIDICGVGGDPGRCVGKGSGSIPLVRYDSAAKTYSGGTLAGEIKLGAETAGCARCVVRARQQGVGAGQVLEASGPLQGGPAPDAAAGTGETTTAPPPPTTVAQSAPEVAGEQASEEEAAGGGPSPVVWLLVAAVIVVASGAAYRLRQRRRRRRLLPPRWPPAPG